MDRAELRLGDELSRERVAELEGMLERSGDYVEFLSRLAQFREPVDQFFDEVMVMVPDARLRANRLALLRTLSDLFLKVADVSRLQG
jgi:glycyl-tRNA synthetase beta chain